MEKEIQDGKRSSDEKIKEIGIEKEENENYRS
jgi:hypothetical protein